MKNVRASIPVLLLLYSVASSSHSWGSSDISEAERLLEQAYRALADSESRTTLRFALENFEKAADLGSLEALHAAGLFYVEGKGVPINQHKAFELFSAAAERGFAPSQNHLGTMYANNFPNPSRVFFNYNRAKYWYEKSANQNYAPAQYNLGNLYRRGRGAKKDVVEAVAWFDKSARQGVPEAQYFLGVALATGTAVPRNLGLAEEWLCKASSQGMADANVALKTYLRTSSETCQLTVASSFVQAEGLINLPREYVGPKEPNAVESPSTLPVTEQEIERLIYAYAQLTLAADNGSIAAIREKQKMKSFLTEYQKHQALLLARKMLFSEPNPDT